MTPEERVDLAIKIKLHLDDLGISIDRLPERPVLYRFVTDWWNTETGDSLVMEKFRQRMMNYRRRRMLPAPDKAQSERARRGR